MSRSSFPKIAFVASISIIIQVSSAHAQDASFACKVLLCGAATNPSWTSIPYCVPIMQQAVVMQAYGLAVGICAEAMQGANSNRQQNQSYGLPSSGLTTGPSNGSKGAYPWVYAQPGQ
jgi:hypothetical protein